MAGEKRLGFDPSWVVYGVIGAVMVYLLFVQFSGPQQTVEIRRVVTEVPAVESDVEITAGKSSADNEFTLEEWWAKSLETPCTGVERFYSGEGFMQDWNSMITKYNSIYSYTGEEIVGIKPPSAMSGNATSYDCEDMAHATRCLAEKYGITCSFWMRQNTGAVVPKSEGHLGVCCQPTPGDWKCI
jgi:hypothetical protein